MMKDIKKVFVECLTSKLAFLVDEYGFQQPVYEEQGYFLALLLYSQGRMGVEVILDLHDQIVDAYMVHLDNGKVPGAWRFDDTGRVVREGINIAQFAQADPEFETWRQKWRRWTKKHRCFLDNNAFAEYVCLEAEFYEWGLRKYGDSLLRWAREQFGLPPEP
jgi:hypothetical protein